jgi:hypothetical protein
MRRSRENSALFAWAQAFWRDCGLTVDVEVFENMDRDALTVRVRDRETDILWRFDVMRDFCVRDSRGAEAYVIDFFEEQELRIRQATFYVHHCREILRAVQQERHEAYTRALLEMRPEARA